MSLQGRTVQFTSSAESYMPDNGDGINAALLLGALSPEDQQQFQTFGVGPKVRPRFSLIHQAFEYFAQQQPEQIAVTEIGGRSVSYRELDHQARQLAARLYQSGVRRGDAVCLYVRRSIEMVVGILGCLKLGACYVPQDMLVCPEKQRNDIVELSEARVILTTERYLPEIPDYPQAEVIAIDSCLNSSSNVELLGPLMTEQGDAQDTAVIIFTSGTTGRPNGVQVSHANLANILLTAPGDMGIRPGVKVGQILNIAFDMAAWETLGCLSNGGTLLIRDKSFQAVAEQADVLISTPSVLTTIDAARCQQVRAVAVAGEPCPRSLAETWGAFCDFYNSCGPTETTIINTAEVFRPDDKYLSIGKPTPNNTVYVLNEQMQPCAIGEVGEMWAGGDCVTKGYINNPELTADRYRDDPYLGRGRKMFRTRDLGRWTEEGTLEHLGRVDDQVKIRGFRVELDSVSAALESAEGCVRAVALKLNSRHLVGFVSPATVDTESARQQVLERLPYYCEPLFILALGELPKTIRGKIDKRLLMEMAEAHHQHLSDSHSESLTSEPVSKD